MKIKWKITIALDVFLLILIVLTSVSIRSMVIKSHESETDEALKNYSSMSMTLLDTKYPGDWRLDGDTLYKGEVKMNGNYEVVDTVAKDTGSLATIFANDTRIATTVRDNDNNRMIGSKASNAVIDKVLKNHKPYIGSTLIGKLPARVYYEPISDKDGNILGMVFVGQYTDDITHKVNATLKFLVIFQVLFLLVGSIFAFFFGSYIAKAYSVLKISLERLEQGDFNVLFTQKNHKRKDEIGDIIRSFHSMQDKVKNIILSIKASTSEISDSSLILADGANNVYSDVENISATTEELSAGLEETAASSEEMNATSIAIEEEIERVTEMTSNGEQLAIEIKDRAENLKSVALESQKTAIEMYESANTKLRASIEKAAAIDEIKALSKTILGITAQTNLLALNASIESARAGEAGKGFAVVAGEIAKLAFNSKQAVSQIEEISNDISVTVEDIVTDSKQLLEFVDSKVIKDYEFLVETGELYDEDAKTVAQMVSEIKNSATQLNESINYIRRAIDEVTIAAQEGAKGSSEIAEKSTSIFHKTNEVLGQANKNREIATNLDEIVQFFQIDQ